MKTEFKQIDNNLTDHEIAELKNKGWELIFYAVTTTSKHYIFKR